MLTRLDNNKNTATAWLLAVVLFFSGLSFSSPTAYVREGQVKARTELVLSARNHSQKANLFKRFFFSSESKEQFVEFNYSFECYGILTAIQLKEADKIYQHSSSKLMNASFFCQHRRSYLPYLVG